MSCIFPGEIKALKDIWFIRDSFLCDVFDTLLDIFDATNETSDDVTSKKIGENKDKLYIFEYFNVDCYTISSLQQ